MLLPSNLGRLNWLDKAGAECPPCCRSVSDWTKGGLNVKACRRYCQPPDSIQSYPQELCTGGQGVGITSASAERTPPIGDFSRGMSCVLSQNIFAKVRSII